MIDKVVHIVEKELKQILKRDINKRICETYAFLLDDNWWSELEVRHEDKMEKELAKASYQYPDMKKVAQLSRVLEPDDLSSLIRQIKG